MADIGQILGGRYRLIDLLGQGGMATIYRAADTGLGRDVALKLLRSEYLRDPDFSSRFRQEAQAAASLSHPNVVTVYDYGEDPSGPFIVMELVDGEDLATILRRSGALPARQAARIAAGVGRALAAAHASGIVHRDIKPGNVLIGRDGRVKVVDFGIARAVAEAQVTLPGTTLGSVHYFSPEQARGDPTSAASDIYSLGIVLYEMLTGVRPWEGDSAAGVALARLSGPIPDPAVIRSSVPTELAAITRHALARDPADRFTSASAMADQLEAWLAAPQPAAAGIGGAVTGAGAGAASAGLASVAAGVPRGGGPAMSGAPAPTGPAAVISGTARANPARVPYPPEAYVGADEDDSDLPPGRDRAGAGRRPSPPRRTTYRNPDQDDDGGGPGAMVWLTGVAAIVMLAAIAFLAYQLVAGGGPGPSSGPGQVIVPSFVGQTFETAKQNADGLEINLVQGGSEPSDQPVGTILAQDLAVGTPIPRGGTVKVTVAASAALVPVPDLKNKNLSDAIQALIDATLRSGVVSQAPDPVVPAGLVVSQSPSAGIGVATGTPIDFVISTGPEASPSESASPSPSPSPTPPPTPEPTPPPTPEPTPTPTPEPSVVVDQSPAPSL
ncbi:MAG: protein kinase domain-containing protein [Candidatus Limnocylindrales bacterium]